MVDWYFTVHCVYRHLPVFRLWFQTRSFNGILIDDVHLGNIFLVFLKIFINKNCEQPQHIKSSTGVVKTQRNCGISALVRKNIICYFGGIHWIVYTFSDLIVVEMRFIQSLSRFTSEHTTSYFDHYAQSLAMQEPNIWEFIF